MIFKSLSGSLDCSCCSKIPDFYSVKGYAEFSDFELIATVSEKQLRVYNTGSRGSDKAVQSQTLCVCVCVCVCVCACVRARVHVCVCMQSGQ